jgi:hypothetical protein
MNIHLSTGNAIQSKMKYVGAQHHERYALLGRTCEDQMRSLRVNGQNRSPRVSWKTIGPTSSCMRAL